MLVCVSAAAASAGLTLSVFGNTAGAGAPLSTRVIPGLSFTLPGPAPLSASLTGTMQALPGQLYNFTCDFGDQVQFATLHVDDHLVCQHGANVNTGAEKGQGKGCGAPDQNLPCTGVDNPLPTMSRTALPVRMQLLANGGGSNRTGRDETAAAATINVRANVTVLSSPAGRPPSSPVEFVPSLPALEQRRLAMQHSLLTGWGAFYDMSYLDMVRRIRASATTITITY